MSRTARADITEISSLQATDERRAAVFGRASASNDAARLAVGKREFDDMEPRRGRARWENGLEPILVHRDHTFVFAADRLQHRRAREQQIRLTSGGQADRHAIAAVLGGAG